MGEQRKAKKPPRKLTDTSIKNLQPEPERYIVFDTDARGLGVRVSEDGTRRFVFVGRFPGAASSARRSIGEYPTMSLATARAKARRWRELIADGVDPREDEDRRRREEARKRADTFESALEIYAKRALSKQRRGKIVERELRNFYGKRWAGRPLTSIERSDIKEVIGEALDRGAMYQAHNLLTIIRAFFNWVVEEFEWEASPCDRIHPKRSIGERKPRKRTLSDDEVRAFWHATATMPYAWGPYYQLMLLTGCRRDEIAEARWREISDDLSLLTVPAERFKQDATHLVPLAPMSRAILGKLPRFTKSDFLFSLSLGERSLTSFDKAKSRLDHLMRAELGDLAPWKLHDLRRTTRTGLAKLGVPKLIAELAIGHSKDGIERVYDTYEYLSETRQAMELWAKRVQELTAPPCGNIIKLKGNARA